MAKRRFGPAMAVVILILSGTAHAAPAGVLPGAPGAPQPGFTPPPPAMRIPGAAAAAAAGGRGNPNRRPSAMPPRPSTPPTFATQPTQPSTTAPASVPPPVGPKPSAPAPQAAKSPSISRSAPASTRTADSALKNGTHLRYYNPYKDIELAVRAEWDPDILTSMKHKRDEEAQVKAAAAAHRRDRESDEEYQEQRRKEYIAWKKQQVEMDTSPLEAKYNEEKARAEQEYLQLQKKEAVSKKVDAKRLRFSRYTLLKKYIAERSEYFERERQEALERAPAMIKMPALKPVGGK